MIRSRVVDRQHGLDNGRHARLVVGSEHARAVGVDDAVLDHRPHAGRGLHRVHVGVEHDRRRRLALGRPLADEIADFVLRADRPNVLQHWLQDRHHPVLVAPVAVDAEDVHEDLEQAVVVDGDRGGWRCHREGHLQASGHGALPHSVAFKRLWRAHPTVVSSRRRECQREAAGVPHGDSQDGEAMHLTFSEVRPKVADITV